MGVTQIDAMAQIAPEDVPTATWDGVGEPPPEMLFAHMDTNGDGFLDAQEMDGASENEIRQIDKNGYGLIDVNELKEAIKVEEMKEDSVIEETPREPAHVVDNVDNDTGGTCYSGRQWCRRQWILVVTAGCCTAIAGSTTVCGEGGCENLYYCDTSSRRRSDARRRSTDSNCAARRRRRGLDPQSLPTCKAPGCK